MPFFCTPLRVFSSIRTAPRLLGLLCVTGALCGNAFASPVTYSLTGLFSGSLGHHSFSNTQGTFTFRGSDTSDVDTTDPAYFFDTTGTATFQLGTEAAVNILSSTFGVESEYGAASFHDSASDFAVGEYNELTPYDVLLKYGSNTGAFRSYGTQAERTSAGGLILTGASGDVTFTAAPPAVATVTPEPAGLLLTATGLLGAAGTLRRRMRNPSIA